MAQGVNRMESGHGWSQAVCKRLHARAGERGRARGQAQMGEALDDHRGLFDGGNERQGAATVRTGGHVDLEHSFE